MITHRNQLFPLTNCSIQRESIFLDSFLFFWYLSMCTISRLCVCKLFAFEWSCWGKSFLDRFKSTEFIMHTKVTQFNTKIRFFSSLNPLSACVCACKYFTKERNFFFSFSKHQIQRNGWNKCKDDCWISWGDCTCLRHDPKHSWKLTSASKSRNNELYIQNTHLRIGVMCFEFDVALSFRIAKRDRVLFFCNQMFATLIRQTNTLTTTTTTERNNKDNVNKTEPIETKVGGLSFVVFFGFSSSLDRAARHQNHMECWCLTISGHFLWLLYQSVDFLLQWQKKNERRYVGHLSMKTIVYCIQC